MTIPQTSHPGDEIDDLVGWVPFMALQMRCPDNDFTGASGNNPAPKIDYKFTTYFKDLD